PVSLKGLGNKRNYGIRTMTTTDGKLFLGMANAINLHCEGGWELYALSEISADFDADKPVANPFNSFTFYPQVEGNQLFTTYWEFPGGIPGTSTARNPVVYYENTGTYSVNLSVNKFTQSFNIYKEDYITIESIDEAQCQEYYEGWGAISSYMSPWNPELVDMMQAVINNPQFGEMVVLLGEHGIFWPLLGINTLVFWDPYEGYKMKMTEFAGNCVFGEPVTTGEVTIPAGVHYLPILAMETVDADYMFANCTPLIYAYNIYNGEFYWPEGGIFTMETLYPGMAYLVMLSSEYTFVFPDFDKSQVSLPQMPRFEFQNPTTTWETPVNTGTAHIFSVYSESMQEMKTDDVIGAFNSKGECIGMSVIKSSTENLALVIYGDDPTTMEDEGCAEGEIIQFRALENGVEKLLIANFDSRFEYNNGKFASNGFSGIKAFKENPSLIATTHIPGLEIYPNPANDQLNIICPNAVDGTSISIYSIHGKLVSKTELSGDHITLNIGHLENGVYMVKITNSEKVVTKRIVKE
nr:T9SS type A sorting domain-containing protein [Bacteroidota bacterium]